MMLAGMAASRSPKASRSTVVVLISAPTQADQADSLLTDAVATWQLDETWKVKIHCQRIATSTTTTETTVRGKQFQSTVDFWELQINCDFAGGGGSGTSVNFQSEILLTPRFP